MHLQNPEETSSLKTHSRANGFNSFKVSTSFEPVEATEELYWFHLSVELLNCRCIVYAESWVLGLFIHCQ